MKTFQREQEIKSERKTFGKIFILSILAVLAYFIGLVLILPHYNFTPLVDKEPLLLAFFGFSFITYLISKTDSDFWPIYKIMAYTISGLLFYFGLYIYHVSTIVFLFYVPIVLLILMLTDIKTAILSAVIFLIACIFTPDIASFFGISTTINYCETNQSIVKLQDYSIIFFTIYFSFLILYFYSKFSKIDRKHTLSHYDNLPVFDENHSSLFKLDDNYNLSDEKLNVLYDKVIAYFETEKPYQNPDFNITMLTHYLDTNATYVYKALNNKSNKKFKDLVNEYRIKQVLSEFDNQAYKKFTIEHIYLEAGFIQQSTFNRVFKKITGVTPSQYIDDLE